MGGNELEVLEHYNRKIQKYGEQKEAAEILLKCLGKLDQVRVNISLLQNTGIGRTVSALKKRYGDHEIGTKSRDLVNKWKDLVAKEEEEGNSDDNEEEDVGESLPGAAHGSRDIQQQAAAEPPAYIPTPIAPSYTPTPINELPTVVETSEYDDNVHDESQLEKKSKSYSGREKSPEKESDQLNHKSKKKKSHRERNSEEREESKNKVSSKSDRESEKRKDKERSHKHSRSSKEKDVKHSDKEKDKTKDRSRDHKSSKSSHKEKSRDSESDNKHSDKDKNRTKDKDDKPRIKEEKCDNGKVKSKESHTSSVKVKDEKLDSSYGDLVNKIKKEPMLNGFDFMKENGVHESNSKDKKIKDKSKDEDRSKKSKSRDFASVDIFSKSSTYEDESKSRKRSRDDDKDYTKSKRPKSDTTETFVLPAPPSFMPPLPTGPSLIPEISPVYKPLPRLPLQNMEKLPDGKNTDEESLDLLLQNKSRNRAAIYSGTKRKGFFGAVPTLFDQCIQILKDHVDEIDEVGNLGYDILKPVLDRATPQTLVHIEECNPYLMEDTAELWEKFVKKEFRNKEREDMESWKEMYERCTQERAFKLDALKGKVKQCYKAEEDNHRKTKLAYVDIAPKAPRNVRNAQAKHGTALPSGHSMVAGGARPRNHIGDPTASASRAGLVSKKPRTAPMMAKTLKLMKGIKGGFRR